MTALAHDPVPRPTVKAPRREPWASWFANEVEPLFHSAMQSSPEYRRRATVSSPLRFALTYLDHHLVLQDVDPPTVTFSEAHLSLCRSARAWQHKEPWREAWIAPRGLGKTVWAYLVLPLWALAHGHRKFVLAFSYNQDQAKGHMANLREELDTNELLLQDYAHLRPGRTRGARNTASTVATGEIMLASRGLRGTVLGMRHGASRPGLLIGDDLEPMEDKHSPELKQELLKNLLGAILPMASPSAAILLTGTVTMYRSITHDLVIHAKGREHIDWVANAGFRPRVFPGIIEDPITGRERSLWPERWQLTDTHLGEHKRGTREFALNFELDPTPAQGTRGGGFWRPETFRYMDSHRFNALEHVLYIDPALRTGKDNDPTAMVVVGRDPSRRRAIVEQAWHGHVTGEQIRQRIHALLEQEPSLRTIIFEENAGGREYWAGQLEPAGKPLPRGIELRWDWVGGHKEARIKAAHAAYERDQVWHARPLRELEEQMVMWPDPRQHDDLCDATAGALRWAFDRKL
jgi:hypothetical protein